MTRTGRDSGTIRVYSTRDLIKPWKYWVKRVGVDGSAKKAPFKCVVIVTSFLSSRKS